MRSPTDRRRSRVRLTVAHLTAEADAAPVLELPPVPVAVAAGAVAATVGWLLVAGLVMVAWFTARTIPLPQVLAFTGQVWLGGHGAGMTVGPVLVTLVPLGLTALFVLLSRGVVGMALRAVPSGALDGRGAVRAWALAAAGYGLVGAVIALSCGAGPRVGWALLGGVVVGAVGGGWALAGRLRPLLRLPGWTTGLLRAVAAGAATMTALAAGVLLLALLVAARRVGTIENSLAPDGVGAWLLVVAQLLYLPNLLMWTTSWLLGAGFGVGVGSFVSPLFTTVGLLPAIPALGAVPEPGGGSPWSYAWLISGVLAGAVAGWVAVARPARGGGLARALARGAGSGLGTAVLVVTAGTLSRGDLGAGRLSGLGPVLVNLAWLAPLPMVAGGALAAATHWLLRGRRLPQPPGQGGAGRRLESSDREQLTVPLGRRGD